MLTIIWTLINLALLVWIIILAVKAVRLMYREYGKLSAFILTLGMLALLVYGKESNRLLHAKNSTRLNHLTEYYIEKIELTPLQSLSVSIAIDSIEEKYECKTHTNGYMLPTALKWSEISATVLPNSSGYQYNIYGAKEWRLLSFPIYKQIVCLNGEVERKKKIGTPTRSRIAGR